MILISRQDYKEKSKDDLIDEIEEGLNEIDRLKRELRKYKNPNTPPSANQHLKPSAAPQHTSKKKKKHGAPLGHHGSTRLWKPNAPILPIVATECPGCHSDGIKFFKRKKRQQIDEIPQEIKPITTIFGINLIVLVIFLRFIVRGVMRKTVGFLGASFALHLAPASVQAIIARAATAAETEFTQLKLRIRDARIVYADETSFSVLGKNWWVFRSDTDLLLVIRNSLGNNVLEEILGKAFAGIVVCDCWRAYGFLSFASIQRCWAHLLRKSKELCETVAGRHFHEKLTALFDDIKRFNSKERTEKQRA